MIEGREEGRNKMVKEDIYLICPVRNVTKKEKKYLDDYVKKVEAEGKRVHYPPRDVEQDDVARRITYKHKEAMKKVKEVHVYWNRESTGSFFDLGMAYITEKPIFLVNREMIKKTPHKSFQNVLLYLDARYRKRKQGK